MAGENALNQGQAQPAALIAMGITAAVELFEDTGQIFRRYASSRIGNFYQQGMTILHRPDFDGFVWLSVL